MPIIDNEVRNRIRELNDAFRTSLNPSLGKLMITPGVNALPSCLCALAIHRVETFVAFNSDNDPHGEHDFGEFEAAGHRFFFRIDYYDPSLESGSNDPADATKTTRVLTVQLAEEY